MGRGIVEFKKGVKGVEDDVEDAIEKNPEKLEASDNSNAKIEKDNKEHTKEMKG
jgi:sec-independent protein translocase protein TatA